MERDNQQLKFQIDVTRNKTKAIANAGSDIIGKAQSQLEDNARLQLEKELADQTLAKQKENAVAQINLATELAKGRQIREHKFDEPLQKLAKEQIETEQMQHQIESQSHANKALQEYNKMQAMQQIRNENVSQAKDDAGTYAAILDKMNQQASADYAKDQALYKAKNEYNQVANTHHDWLTSHGVLGDARKQYMEAMFNLDLDNATAQDIRSRIDLAQGIADTAPGEGEIEDYVNWAAQAVEGLDQ